MRIFQDAIQSFLILRCKAEIFLFSGKTILGGLENRSGVLVDGDEYDVRREVIKVVENFGRDSFILGADCTLATEQDLKLVRAAVEQARSL